VRQRVGTGGRALHASVNLIGEFAAANSLPPISLGEWRPLTCIVAPAGRTHMATNPDDWTKQLEADLATLASDMWATQNRLEEKGFRVDGGNKSPTGWWLTANNRTMSPGSIKVQSDGTRISVTVEG
jgi:hypothetical protein